MNRKAIRHFGADDHPCDRGQKWFAKANGWKVSRKEFTLSALARIKAYGERRYTYVYFNEDRLSYHRGTFEHWEFYRVGGTPIAIIAHNYNPDVEEGRKIIARYGLIAHVGTKQASWYYPGDTFPSNQHTAVSGWSKVKARPDRIIGDIAPWRLHDCRSTVVTGMAERGTRTKVIEQIVSPISGSQAGVAGIYKRSEMRLEHQAALQRWADHITGLVAGREANVPPIMRKPA